MEIGKESEGGGNGFSLIKKNTQFFSSTVLNFKLEI